MRQLVWALFVKAPVCVYDMISSILLYLKAYHIPSACTIRECALEFEQMVDELSLLEVLVQRANEARPRD